MEGASPVWKIDDKVISTRSFLYNNIQVQYALCNFDDVVWSLRSLLLGVSYHFKKDKEKRAQWLKTLSDISKDLNPKTGHAANNKLAFRKAVDDLDTFMIDFFEGLNEKKLLEQLERDPLEEAGALE